MGSNVVTRFCLAFIILTGSWPLVAAQSPPTKDQLVARATQPLKAGDYVNAYRAAVECLERYPKEKKCQDVLATSAASLKSLWETRLSQLVPENLPEIIKSLEQLTRYADTPERRQALAAAHARRAQVVEAADRRWNDISGAGIGGDFGPSHRVGGAD
jgi:hypothetical protein